MNESPHRLMPSPKKLIIVEASWLPPISELEVSNPVLIARNILEIGL